MIAPELRRRSPAIIIAPTACPIPMRDEPERRYQTAAPVLNTKHGPTNTPRILRATPVR